MTTDAQKHSQAIRSRTGPDWRWQLAVQGVESPARLRRNLADETTKAAASFFALSRRDGKQQLAAERYPQVAAAQALWNQPALQQQFVIMTLGDLPREKIAERLGVAQDVVETTERLFLDVRDMRQATSWISGFVIRPPSQAGQHDVSTKYRTAFWGGPMVAEAILDAPQRLAWNEAQRLADLELQLHMKIKEALDFPLTDDCSAIRLLKIYSAYDTSKQRLEFSREQFRHRCEQDLRRHELAVRRLELAARRHEEQARQYNLRTELSEQRRSERTETRILVEQLRQHEEYDAARNRAAESPLAKLSWPTAGRQDAHRSGRVIARATGAENATTPAEAVNAAA